MGKGNTAKREAPRPEPPKFIMVQLVGPTGKRRMEREYK